MSHAETFCANCGATILITEATECSICKDTLCADCTCEACEADVQEAHKEMAKYEPYDHT